MWPTQRTRDCCLPRKTMATERTGWRRVKLTLLMIACMFLSGIACRRDDEADRQRDKLNSLSNKGDHTTVKGRLVNFKPLSQTETDFVDLSSDSDLIQAILLPARTADDLSGPYQEVCQIQITENSESRPTVFHIYWLGDGPPLYSVNDSPHRYVRAASPPPNLRRDEHVDEALSVCGLIQALATGDKAGRAEIEKVLRRSTGLDSSK